MIEDLLTEIRDELKASRDTLCQHTELLERLAHPTGRSPLVPIKQAAQALSLSERTIRNRIARGEYPVYGSGRELRVDVAELRDLMAKARTPRINVPVIESMIPSADPFKDTTRPKRRKVGPYANSNT